MSTTNYVQKWNGTQIVDSLIFDNGTDVGIGTASPAYLLDVAGTVRASQFNGTILMATTPISGVTQLKGDGLDFQLYEAIATDDTAGTGGNGQMQFYVGAPGSPTPARTEVMTLDYTGLYLAGSFFSTAPGNGIAFGSNEAIVNDTSDTLLQFYVSRSGRTNVMSLDGLDSAAQTGLSLMWNGTQFRVKVNTIGGVNYLTF